MKTAFNPWKLALSNLTTAYLPQRYVYCAGCRKPIDTAENKNTKPRKYCTPDCGRLHRKITKGK